MVRWKHAQTLLSLHVTPQISLSPHDKVFGKTQGSGHDKSTGENTMCLNAEVSPCQSSSFISVLEELQLRAE